MQTVSSKLPFLDGASSTTAFLPSLTDNGTIIVVAGDCQIASSPTVWSLTPTTSTGSNSASWMKQAVALNSSGAYRSIGPYFLGGNIAFSVQLAPNMSQPTIYSYGGMCSRPSTTSAGWQGSGTYSNQMIKMSPQPGITSGYTVGLVSNRGQPVAEAGFTLTTLTPSMRNLSGVVTQQSNHVLLGGHTAGAFINMSTAAIWNLPEETWNFVSIEQPAVANTELAIKAAAKRAAPESVDSRSGHTAVMSEDGNSIVVLGGWVGNISQAASPQLAILEIGETFKGWRWSIPAQQPAGPAVYGHGAALLPGNVMMTYGGYEISTSNSKVKRLSSTSTAKFLNLTSLTWSSTYTNPIHATNPQGPSSTGGGPGSGSSSNSGSSNNASNNLGIGLGVGLGVGVPLIIALVVAYFCYKRYMKGKRNRRDETIRALAQDTSHFLHGEDEMMEQDDVGPSFPWSSHAWYTGGDDPYEKGVRSLGYETLRGNRNSGYGDPSGMHIPRKPIPRAARGLYQSTGSRPSSHIGAPGRIHPIYEADEDVESPYEPESSNGHGPRGNAANEPATPTSVACSDPFVTPITANAPVLYPPSRASTTPSPENRNRDPEVQDWVSDVDAAEVLLARIPPRSGGGRLSPTRRNSVRSARYEDDSRTGSNISESNRSALSVSRSTSGRSHVRAGAFNSSGGATTLLGGGSVIAADDRLGSSSSSGKETFNTAKSSFQVLQAEGPSLLMGTGRRRNDFESDDEDPPIPGSPSKSKPRRGWLGSLRRVFSSGTNSSPSSSRDESPARASLDQVSSDYEPRLVGLRGIGGGALLRRKQGRQAWEESKDTEDGANIPRKSVEDEWDIEKAVEQRLVQVMFTVPKERLRVVNAEIEKEEEVVLVDPEKEDQVDGDGDGLFEDIETPDIPEKSAFRDTGKGRELLNPAEALDDSRERRASSTMSDRVLTAEAIRFERPRTRVLDMVDSIEKRSRSTSPAPFSSP
jgi:hypothetical protein